MTSLDDHGPVLTPVEAAALHDRPEPVALFVLPAPYRNGVIARAHTETHHGGHLLPGHLAADDLDELRAMLPPAAGPTTGRCAVGGITVGMPGMVVNIKPASSTDQP